MNDSPLLAPIVPLSCGCTFKHEGDDERGSFEFVFCPMHEAAPELLKAASEYFEIKADRDRLITQTHPWPSSTYLAATSRAVLHAEDRLKAAIYKASRKATGWTKP